MSAINKDVLLSPEILRRINSMHDEKVKQNKIKLEAYGGFYNTDDHGFIYFPDFKYEPIYAEGKDETDSGVLAGKNLRKFLSQIPGYCYKDSALAGCWVGCVRRYMHIRIPSENLMPPDLEAINEKYHMRRAGIGGTNHLGPDVEIGLRLGWKGIFDRLLYYKEFHAPASAEFYEAHEDTMHGIMTYIENNAKYVRKLYEEEPEGWYKDNYKTIADILDKLMVSPPETFREACQFLAIFQSVDRTYFMGGALGQLDELLRPYFERDMKAGILTEEEAVWMVASLFYNDTHYSQLGGRTPDGKKSLNSRMSFIILQAAHTLHIPYNLAIRVYEGQDESLLDKSLEYILEKGSGPAFSLSKGIEEGFMKQGHPKELARMRAKVGCNWVALPGIEYPLQDVTRLNLAWPLVYALDDVMEAGEPTLEKLWDRYAYHTEVMCDAIKRNYDIHLNKISDYIPELVLNLFCHGPVERGLNCASGGVDIINLNCDGIAIATVADSFAAIEQRVVKEKKLTWEELYEALKCDFEGKEDIRLMLKSIPRFGSPESLAKKWAKRISEHYVEEITKSPTPENRIKVIPGHFSHGGILSWGKYLPATPNGRKMGDAISHSSEPDPGFAKGLTSFSPTLKANAVALTQPGWGNSAPLHLDIDSDMVIKNGGIDCLKALIMTHNEMGGTLINLNCITKEQIMRAHADPESEPDLVVRVTGYSAFFASLSKEYRQQVVDRYLTNN